MRKKKKNEFLKSDAIIPNEGDLEDLIHQEEIYDESARLKKLVMLFTIPLIFILGFLYRSKFNKEYQEEKVAQYHAQKQEQQEQKKQEQNQKKLEEANLLLVDADKALEQYEFTKAVFLIRQAISYQPQKIEFHKKLLSILEKSCEQENEIHCNAIEQSKEKIKKLENTE